MIRLALEVGLAVKWQGKHCYTVNGSDRVIESRQQNGTLARHASLVRLRTNDFNGLK
jgi:hypothetical protein